MTQLTVSRSTFDTACPLSLADVLARVRADEQVPPRLQQDIASALHTLAKALGKGLTGAPAEPFYIRARLKGFAPAIIGVTPSRWANVLSLHRKALTLAGLGDLYTRKRVPLLPIWAEALALIPEDHLKYRLSAFGRYCSALGIRPDQVDDEILKAYWAHLEQTELSRRPQDLHRELCVTWNKVAELVPEWPQQRVEVPQYRAWYSLDWDAFPQSLRDEVDQYLYYLSGEDTLKGCPKPLRPASIKGRRETLRAYLTAVVGEGAPATLTCLADAVQIEAFERGLRFFLKRVPKTENAPKENKSFAARVAYVIITLARYWVKVDEAHLDAMLKLGERLRERNKPRGMGEKSRTRLKQFDDPKQVVALARLPLNLIKDTPATGRPTYAEALKFQTAAAIEILTLTCLRMQNLANLEIGRQITWTPKSHVMHICIPGDEVKNGMPITRVIPPESAKLIETYIERYRPVLLKAPSDHLFPGREGGAKQKAYLSRRISDCIKRKTGLVMHAHMFRHFAAKTYLDAHPGAYGVVRLLHADKSVDTTTAFYADGTEAAAAFRHYDAHLAKLRAGRDATVSAKPDRRKP